ncbi:MAG: amino acid adenylation domain-containing protein [Thiotrichaceae bacterium]|nr:amino acid adenylation domain-containing protein [Thiotrichaceae bacterium]
MQTHLLSLVGLFENQVVLNSHQTALSHHSETVSYKHLNQRANQLAHYLQTIGVQSEQLVGICMPRSIDMMVAILGILKAGAAYVPLDANYPHKRLNYMLENSQLKHLIMTEATRELLSGLSTNMAYQTIHLEHDAAFINQQPTTNLLLSITPQDLAYCLYTSGSTGLPKAVLMEHDSLVNLINWHLKNRITGARQLQFAPISFDISIHEIFATWCSGGTLFIIDENIRRNPVALLDFICTHRLEKLYLPFTPLQQLAVIAHDSGRYPLSVREIITAGEQLQITLPIRALFKQTKATLHHHYGATECQDVTTLTLKGSPDDWSLLPSIGQAISNIETYILDKHQKPVAKGEVGELFIGGKGIARGYLFRPELTQQKFHPNPFGEGRLYETCDYARYLPSGDIELLGRSDQIVKIRGFRVELGEVEATLLQHEAIDQSVVMVHEDEARHKRLVAYLILHKTASLPRQMLQDYLACSLPEYMIPAIFLFLDKFPVTPTGKVERSKLPKPPKQSRPHLDQHFEQPSTPLERQLAIIWQSILHIEQIGIHDDFYELGGDSLLLIKLFIQIKQTLKIKKLSFANLLQNVTIAHLAEVLADDSIGLEDVSIALTVDVMQQRAQLRLAELPAPQQYTPKTILLTGATGFLGTFLLHELLEQFPQSTIYCLVRSHSIAQAKQRIINTQQRFCLSLSPDAEQRLQIIVGDLSQPLLGLNTEQFQALAQQIHCIYHAAANINMLYAYETLDDINVQGTREIIQLATTGLLKPIHYISSTAIFEAKGFFEYHEPIAETVDLMQCQEVYGGYAQTKWVAECLLQQAREQGVPVNIYRLGMLTGHSQTGVANTDDVLSKLFKLFIQQQSMPQLSQVIDMIPVDYASQAIIYLSQQSLGQVFHFTNPSSLSFNQLAQCFNEMGCSVQSTPYAQWLEQLKAMPIDSDLNVLGAMLPLFTEPVEAKTYLEFTSLSLPLKDDNTQFGLQNAPFSCPMINLDLLNIYFAYFVQQGFLADTAVLNSLSQSSEPMEICTC